MERAGNDIVISIVMATYNAAAMLPDCLLSIEKKNINKLEVVIVDGGSNDGTINIIKNSRLDNLVWVSEPDNGIYDALNKGAKIARGKWIHFLGADDRLLNGFADMVKNLQDEDAIYYGNSKPYYYGNGRPPYILLGGKFNNYRIAKYCVNHQAVIYPAKVFLHYTYNLQYNVFADYALNLVLWGNKRYRKIFYPIDMVSYNMNGFSSTINDDLFKQHKPGMIKKNLGWFIYLRFSWKKYRKKLGGEPNW